MYGYSLMDDLRYIFIRYFERTNNLRLCRNIESIYDARIEHCAVISLNKKTKLNSTDCNTVYTNW